MSTDVFAVYPWISTVFLKFSDVLITSEIIPRHPRFVDTFGRDHGYQSISISIGRVVVLLYGKTEISTCLGETARRVYRSVATATSTVFPVTLMNPIASGL